MCLNLHLHRTLKTYVQNNSGIKTTCEIDFRARFSINKDLFSYGMTSKHFIIVLNEHILIRAVSLTRNLN